MYAIINIEFVGYVIVVPYGFLMGMAIVPSEGYRVLQNLCNTQAQSVEVPAVFG